MSTAFDSTWEDQSMAPCSLIFCRRRGVRAKEKESFERMVGKAKGKDGGKCKGKENAQQMVLYYCGIATQSAVLVGDLIV
eukprot:1049161-Amphidinium_carterae.2